MCLRACAKALAWYAAALAQPVSCQHWRARQHMQWSVGSFDICNLRTLLNVLALQQSNVCMQFLQFMIRSDKLLLQVLHLHLQIAEFASLLVCCCCLIWATQQFGCNIAVCVAQHHYIFINISHHKPLINQQKLHCSRGVAYSKDDQLRETCMVTWYKTMLCVCAWLFWKHAWLQKLKLLRLFLIMQIIKGCLICLAALEI